MEIKEGLSARQEGEIPEEEKEEKKERGLDWFSGNVKDCAEFLAVCWAFLMLAIFPVYVIDRYQDIGAYKFSFFSGVSTLFLVPGAALGILYVILRRVSRREKGLSLSWLDAGVLAYLLCNIISFFGSDFKADAWAGVGGWNMGLRSQLLMIAAYFLMSRFFPLRRKKLILAGAMLGSGAAFAVGVLHRFSIDPFGFYQGLDADTRLRFLSTIGQATWYSSFVCTVLPIGLCVFYVSGKTKARVLSGLYCVLGFMTLVTQNSDSAFAALHLLNPSVFCRGGFRSRQCGWEACRRLFRRGFSAGSCCFSARHFIFCFCMERKRKGLPLKRTGRRRESGCPGWPVSWPGFFWPRRFF